MCVICKSWFRVSQDGELIEHPHNGPRIGSYMTPNNPEQIRELGSLGESLSFALLIHIF